MYVRVRCRSAPPPRSVPRLRLDRQETELESVVLCSCGYSCGLVSVPPCLGTSTGIQVFRRGCRPCHFSKTMCVHADAMDVSSMLLPVLSMDWLFAHLRSCAALTSSVDRTLLRGYNTRVC